MKKNKTLSEKVQLSKQSANGNEEMLLAQWKTCVEMANAISERRDAMNDLFVTLNLAIVAVILFM